MPGSFLAVEEYFRSGDPHFLEELLSAQDAKRLAGFAVTWQRDPRPWAKAQLHAYLDLPLCHDDNHKPLVKRLFKLAESGQDDATMACFLVAFDRSVRRRARKRWNWQLREMEDAYRAGVGIPSWDGEPLFSVHTRNYLRRRAWRYFRWLGHRDPKRYMAAIHRALALYRDEDCDSGIHFLDNWGLVHALFRDSAVLRRTAHAWWVRDGQALRDLKPSPAFAQAWDGEAVLTLLTTARARPVRRAALAMIQAKPGLLSKIPFDRVMGLFEHPDEEVQALGAELLRSAAVLDAVPLEVWLRLLEVKSLTILSAVCEAMEKAVEPARLSTEQLLRFACAPLGPVARLGLEWLKLRPVPPEQLVELAGVRAASVAADAVAFARGKLADPAAALAFLDSTTREVREAAWPWFLEQKRADLWAKAIESPYDDVRLAIVRHAEDAGLPLEPIWTSVILNVQRGNREKRRAVMQVADAIAREPGRAAQLLPLLRIAARSVRAPEFRAGLASVVRVATRRPEVASAVAAHFPELKL